MNLKTRLFGQRLESEELANLMDILNIDKSILSINKKDWTTQKYWGRCLITPNKESLNFDLYIFRRDFYILEGGDLEIMGNEAAFKELGIFGKKIYDTSEHHYRENIPYNKIAVGEKVR